MTTMDGESTPLPWPQRRASLIAASFASQPELQKNTESMPLISASMSAARSCSVIRYRLEAWISREACSEMARVSLGFAWPRVFTAIPARASRYFLPEESQTQTPSPWVKATGIREYVFIRWDMGSTVQIFSGAGRTPCAKTFRNAPAGSLGARAAL